MFRIATLALGGCVLFWVWLALPEIRAGSAYTRTADRILQGEPLRKDHLEREIVELTARPAEIITFSHLRMAESLLRIRAFEMALLEANPVGLDGRMTDLSASLRTAVSENPADPLAWTMMYWLESIRLGSLARSRAYLEFSYKLGPHEGYVALRRNALGLANYRDLDGAVQKTVVREFADLLNERFMDAVTANLLGPGWPVRDRLMEGLSDTDPGARRLLAKNLFNQGVNLTVPGTADLEDRPWR